MKKADIIKRIIEIVDAKSKYGVLNLLRSPGWKPRSIHTSGGKYYYTYHNTIRLDYLHKHQLADLLFEIGDEQDRSSVRESMDLETYIWLSYELGLIKHEDK